MKSKISLKQPENGKEYPLCKDRNLATSYRTLVAALAHSKAIWVTVKIMLVCVSYLLKYERGILPKMDGYCLMNDLCRDSLEHTEWWRCETHLNKMRVSCLFKNSYWFRREHFLWNCLKAFFFCVSVYLFTFQFNFFFLNIHFIFLAVLHFHKI